MNKETKLKTKILADFLGLQQPCNLNFKVDWKSIKMVLTKIRTIEDGRWKVDFDNRMVMITDRNGQGWEWTRTDESTSIELLFYGLSFYIEFGLFKQP
jgi:hypothetical protein